MSIEFFTPTSIKECCEDDDGNAIDCFENAVPTDDPYRDRMVATLWATYRYQMISSLNIDRWLQYVKDRAYLVDRKYQYLIGIYNGNDIDSPLKGYIGSTTNDQTTSVTDGLSTTTTVTGTDSTETTRTTKDTETGTDTTATTGTNTTTATGTIKTQVDNEDLPATSSASTSTYLSDRNTTTETPNTTTTETPDLTETRTPNLSKDGTVSETVTRSPATSTTKANSGTKNTGVNATGSSDMKYWDITMMETIALMKDAYFDPYVEYAKEFQDLFINRWGTGGCC